MMKPRDDKAGRRIHARLAQLERELEAQAEALLDARAEIATSAVADHALYLAAHALAVTLHQVDPDALALAMDAVRPHISPHWTELFGETFMTGETSPPPAPGRLN